MPSGPSDQRSDVAVLRVEVDGRVGRHELAPGELVTIGRGSACAVQVPHTSVSREHCVAVLAGDGIRLNDMRSRHGIKLDGQRVEHCVLAPGASCRIGSAVLTHESAGAEPVAADPGEDQADDVEQEDAPLPPALESEEPPPERIGQYRLLEKLGEGGFGTVYRAEQESLGRQVALKVLKRGTGHEQERIQALQAEARAAAKLAHPHLVQVYDVGEADGQHFLSMELIEGESLVRRIRRTGPMPWQDVIELIRDVAKALTAAHAAGIVHRDIKPANILFDQSGRAKLVDLGMASGLGHGGTVAYMAPEQLRRLDVDARTDLYALGVTAYAALTGNPPFRGSRSEIARAQVQVDPPSLYEQQVHVPYHIEELVVDSLLAKSPEDRPQSATELLDRLERLNLSGGPSGPKLTAGRRRGRDGARGGAPWMVQVVTELVRALVVAALVIGLLLLLKTRWGFDIYAYFGG